MPEIDLMKGYPASHRSTIRSERVKVSQKDREKARKFGKEYFDGPRRLGMGGYSYNSKYFQPVVRNMINHYGLTNGSSVLDVGCAKGFMLHDFKVALPNISIAGIDISTYCLDNALESVKKYLRYASCEELPYPDDSFDLAIAIATIHNLDIHGVKRSLREIMRVSKGNCFIKVNGYKNDEERVALEEWNLVAKTILHVDEWKSLFSEVGFTGDYFWFTA